MATISTRGPLLAPLGAEERAESRLVHRQPGYRARVVACRPPGVAAIGPEFRPVGFASPPFDDFALFGRICSRLALYPASRQPLGSADIVPRAVRVFEMLFPEFFREA
jgi:hypothetical protein